ncbi:MAG: ABC transporter permease [Deltaproteobacteria bacterium]|nr:ABC transporter permease [Deltaproteobacteria bacterium]MBI3075444.1 ABC transporter permease [Deltaproteobacteria bacterium]
MRSARGLGQAVPVVVLTALLLAAWEVATPLLQIPVFILPPPSATLRALMAERAVLLDHSLVTLKEIVLGFLIGDALGILLAVVVGQFRVIERSLYPLIVFFQNTPKISIAPVFVLWFGYGLAPKVTIIVVISFFPVIVNTLYGLKFVEPNLLDLARSVSASRWDVLTKIQLPHALPYMFEGFKIAITLSVIGAIVGEWVGSDAGLGFMILLSSTQLETAKLFAAITVISVIGVALFYLISLAERLLLPWHEPAGAQVVAQAL